MRKFVTFMLTLRAECQFNIRTNIFTSSIWDIYLTGVFPYSQTGLELMKQIRKPTKYKSAQKLNAFISVNSIWCTIADVKITLGDNPEHDTREIQELLDNWASSNKPTDLQA